MNNDKPLDKYAYTQDEDVLTAQKIIQKLQGNGFPNCYEDGQGNVVVKGINSLNCLIRKGKANDWGIEVSVEWLSAYVFVPSVVFMMGFKMLGLGGAIPMMISSGLGIGVGSIILNTRKQNTYSQLWDAIYT